jgi:hypothetical protein
MSIEAIRIICPSCKGEERPLIPHAACGGTGLIDGQPDPECGGTGLIADDVCGFCNGAYTVGFGMLDDDLIDLLNDIKNKCNDIFEKVYE